MPVRAPYAVFGGFDNSGRPLKPDVLGEVDWSDIPKRAVEAELAARGALGLSCGYWNDLAGCAVDAAPLGGP